MYTQMTKSDADQNRVLQSAVASKPGQARAASRASRVANRQLQDGVDTLKVGAPEIIQKKVGLEQSGDLRRAGLVPDLGSHVTLASCDSR